MKSHLNNFRRYYPWLHLIPNSVLVELATLGALGRVKKAPGTVGSLAGLFLYSLLFHQLDPLRFLLLSCLCAYIAIGICDAAEKHLQMRDPGMIVLDEFVAMPLVFSEWVAIKASSIKMLAGRFYCLDSDYSEFSIS